MTIEEMMKDPSVIRHVMSTRLTSAERETHINIDYGSDTAYAYSSIPKHYKRFAKNGWKLVSVFLGEDGSLSGAEFTCPARCISFRKNAIMSEEDKIKIASRLKGVRREDIEA